MNNTETADTLTLTQQQPTASNEISLIGKVSRIRFTGNASDYFGIWIVNILLTIVTLGIYAPWAKVRRMRYFYNHTHVGGNNFDFTAVPSQILKSRLIIGAIYFTGYMLSTINVVFSLLFALAIIIAVPWVIKASYRFTARNSVYRNIRFSFAGTYKQVAGIYSLIFLPFFLFFMGWGVMTALAAKGTKVDETLEKAKTAAEEMQKMIESLSGMAPYIAVGVVGFFALLPLWMWLFNRYKYNHLSLGHLPFGFHTPLKSYYAVYALPLLAFAALLGVSWSVSHALFPLTIMIGLFVIGPFISAGLFNVNWNSMTLGKSRFRSMLKPWSYVTMSVVNTVARVLSLGLLGPWATVREARIKVEAMRIKWGDEPRELIAVAQSKQSAAGEELAEFLDIDVAL